MLRDVVLRSKLILRLMGDRRVSLWLKLIPIGTLIYWLSPVDAIAGIPGLSALDDIAVLGVGMYTFIEMCPPDVVREIREDLYSIEGDDDGEIIDGETSDVNDTK